MRKKEEWMFTGSRVIAIGKEGVITKMEQNRLNDVDYVYYINVRLKGEKWAGRYHPNDITEFSLNPHNGK